MAARAQDPPVCLEVIDLHKSFGGVNAVQGAAFTVARGSITGLVGPNGAGKSTAINLISGLVKPDKGRVRLNGQQITGHSLEWISRHGLVRTFQVAREWPALTAMENVLAAAPAGNRETIWRALFALGLAAHLWPDHLGDLAALWQDGISFFKIFTCDTHGIPGLGSLAAWQGEHAGEPGGRFVPGPGSPAS